MTTTAIGIGVQVGVTLAILTSLPGLGKVAAAPADLTATFQTLEQSLMNAVAVGDKAVWARTFDEGCVMTDEEGGVSTKKDFLQALGPLPPVLSGAITVRELSAQAFPTFVVVRYLADEWEQVFGQRLTTKLTAPPTRSTSSARTGRWSRRTPRS